MGSGYKSSNFNMGMQKSKEPPRTPEHHHATSVEHTNSYPQNDHSMSGMPQVASFNRPPQSAQRDSLAGVTRRDGRSEKVREDDCLRSLPSSPNIATGALVNKPTPQLMRALNLTIHELELLHEASDFPPVTKLSLKELDLLCIMNKLALRIDVNYDRDLHFTPARHEKDNPRRIAAERYWEALALELKILDCKASCDAETEERIELFKSRLPGLFDTIREVLQTLAPTRDHGAIVQALDTDLLMQQVRHKVLDMVALANWLADLLKMHCAPMRDKRADNMAMEIQSGCLTNDMQLVAKGLQSLFGVLETMKLDVANHQIRTFRIFLIEDTIRFLQDRYLKQIAEGERETHAAILWYKKLQRRFQVVRSDVTIDDDLYNVAIVIRGMCESLVTVQPTRLPKTFEDEKVRIGQLRTDLHDLIHLDVCCYLLDLVLGGGPQTVQTYNVLKTRLWYIVEESDEAGYSASRWTQSIDAIALEIARAKTMISPDCGPICARTINEAELLVREHFTHFSQVYMGLSFDMTRRLEEETSSVAKRYLQMSPLEISESQRGPSYPNRKNGHEPYPNVQSVAKRLAHVVVLHWWVWGPLVYLRKPEAEGSGAGEERSPRPYSDDDFQMEV